MILRVFITFEIIVNFARGICKNTSLEHQATFNQIAGSSVRLRAWVHESINCKYGFINKGMQLLRCFCAFRTWNLQERALETPDNSRTHNRELGEGVLDTQYCPHVNIDLQRQ